VVKTEAVQPEASRKYRVLVVDDNRDAADTLATLLDLLGCDARTAYDGPSALAAIDAWLPAAVLLDLGMPGMDGYEVARKMRRDRSIVLVAVTGWGQEEDVARTRAAGFHHHLTKPVDVEGLRALLDALKHPVEPPARAAKA
jgi:CheY-like chemotaxis protein